MKVGLGVLFGCAIFIVIAATIRLALTMTVCQHPAAQFDESSSSQQRARCATRPSYFEEFNMADISPTV